MYIAVHSRAKKKKTKKRKRKREGGARELSLHYKSGVQQESRAVLAPSVHSRTCTSVCSVVGCTGAHSSSACARANIKARGVRQMRSRVCRRRRCLAQQSWGAKVLANLA